ncbi:MAG: DUF362 domain-containing protein [Deltaproteobacteria bacterium]|nr:DUF362 domain-containing protein [Deltaproteobacteria bacterium]
MPKIKIAVLRTSPKTVIEDISHVMKTGEVRQALELNATTILKDNISWHFPFLSANTTPWQLEGTILGLREEGHQDLVAVHNNTVVTDPFKGGRLNRLTPLYQQYGILERYNFDPSDMKWITYRPKARMRVLDEIYPEGIRLPDFFFGKNVVHLPTVKCHIYTTTTGAMKNAFGGLLNTKRHYTHSHIHETLVDLLAIQREIHSGIFTVMDGTLAGNGPGPRTMFPVQKDVILAGGDSVAIDAVAAKLMGFDPMSLKYIRLAHEDGLGTGDPRDIEVVGDDISRENWGFTVGDNMASNVGDLLWFSSLRRFQKIFFRTPLVYLFILGSFLFHDYVWWPTVGKARMRKTLESPWGRLFLQYRGIEP